MTARPRTTGSEEPPAQPVKEPVRRLPTNRVDLTPSAALRRALAVVDHPEGRDLINRVEDRMRRTAGPKRQISVRVFAACCIANAALLREPQAVIIRTFMSSLPRGVQRQHNIIGRSRPYTGHLVTHRQVDTLLANFAKEMTGSHTGHNHAWADPDTGEIHPASTLTDTPTTPQTAQRDQDPLSWIMNVPVSTDDPTDCHPGCPVSQNLNWFFDRLIGVAWNVLGIPDCTTHALDSTHLTSHYRRLAWGAASDADLDSLEAQNDNPDDSPTENTGRNETKKEKDAKKKAKSPAKFRTADENERAKRLYAQWAAEQPAQPAYDEDGKRIDVRRRAYGPTVTGDFTVLKDGWPRLGPDGRLRQTLDPDVCEGWHSGQNGERSTTSPQRDIHTVVASGHDSDGRALPPFLRGFRSTPGGSHKGDAGVSLLTDLVSSGQVITDVQADRVYTVTDADRFAHPVRRAGIAVALDLHPNQRTAQDDYANVLVIDGGFFASSLPDHLRDLPALPRGATREQRDASEAVFNARAKTYGFLAHAAARPDGSRRYQGPAVRGRLRCRNYPASVRSPASKTPTTTCRPGDNCSCGKTITIPGTVVPKIRQDEFWGTTAWRKRMNRRNLVESGNSYFKYHLGLGRHSIRVFGDARTHLHLGLWLVGTLIEQARRWHLTKDQPDPAAVHDDEPDTHASPPTADANDTPHRSGAPPG